MATILIVDDLAANRKFLVTLLSYEGHRMLDAADGSEGLDVARSEHPDLVITDVLMPKMDGYELVRQLRLDPTTRGIPVVFCTAHYGEREARTLALSSGVSYVLTKPAESAEVLKIVGRVLSGKLERGMLPDESAFPTDFDREHLQLLTDKLSEKAGDLRTANARLRALINIGLELASEHDSDRLLQSVCVAARELFGATYVTLGIVDLNDRTLERAVTWGVDAASWIKPGDPVAGILGTVVTERRTLRGDNAGGDPARLALPSLHPEVQSFLAAPIASPAHVYGWICLVGNEGKSFNEDDEQLVRALSGQVGRIYENSYFSAVMQKRAEELEHEILERKQAEEALRHERDRAQRYLDTAAVIMVALDRKGRITLVNRHACSVLGWTAAELLGRDFTSLLPAQMRDAHRKRFNDVVGGGLLISEDVILTKSGEERTIEWHNTMLRDDAGHVIGTLSSGTDNTERKQAEQALEQSRQDQLRFKDEFLSHVSHELRSPLTAIKQFTTIILGGLAGELNKEQHDYQQIVLKNINQLQSMIDDLLEVTRLETGKLTVEPEIVFVADAVTEILTSLQGTARAKGVALSSDLSPELPRAHADRIRLRQILIILLDNAIKFTPIGGAVTIHARLLERDPRFLLLEVADTGCGIRPEIAERIFERLFQVTDIHASRKGLGLGLFICKELVTRQGGQIWVKSELEKGSTFSFTLPVFSLNNVIAPLLKNNKWPAESVAIVMVETRLRGAWPSKEFQEGWSRDARSLLQRCLLPDADVLLPQMSSAANRERFFIAAFANETGASILANRIRQQFEELPHLKQTGLTVSVSYRMLQPLPQAVGASRENILTSMSTSLEASSKAQISSEGDHE